MDAKSEPKSNGYSIEFKSNGYSIEFSRDYRHTAQLDETNNTAPADCHPSSCEITVLG
jgi:hypothetical protein